MTVRGPGRHLITEVQNFCYRPQERFWCQVCWLSGSGVCCAACCSSHAIITSYMMGICSVGVCTNKFYIPSFKKPTGQDTLFMSSWFLQRTKLADGVMILSHYYTQSVFCGRWRSQIRKTVRRSGSAKQSLASAWRMQAWYGRRPRPACHKRVFGTSDVGWSTGLTYFITGFITGHDLHRPNFQGSLDWLGCERSMAHLSNSQKLKSPWIGPLGSVVTRPLPRWSGWSRHHKRRYINSWSAWKFSQAALLVIPEHSVQDKSVCYHQSEVIMPMVTTRGKKGKERRKVKQGTFSAESPY